LNNSRKQGPEGLATKSTKIQHFWKELRRRKTIRTAVAYLIIFAAVIGPASDILDGLDAPDWILRYTIIALIIGFPVVLVFSWIFDITLHGLKRTKLLPEDAAEKAAEDAAEDAAEKETKAADGPAVKESEKTAIGEPVAIIAESRNDADKPSVAIETGSAHLHQVTLLRSSLTLTRDGSIIDDPELLNELVVEAELLVNAIAEKYSAIEISHVGTAFEFLFGYPHAHDNDAIRAVVTGLAIIDDLKHFSNDKDLSNAYQLTATIGIHSDMVIIDSASSNSSGISVVGTALQEAAWVESQVEPGNVVLDSFTNQLLRDRLHCEQLGIFKNVQNGKATVLFKAIEMRPAEWLVNSISKSQQVFLGRDTEIALIMDRWQRAREGENAFVVLRGEAGIGKSTITRNVLQKAMADENVLVMPMYCSPLEQNTAFQPIIEYMLGSGLGLRRERSAAKRTQRLQEVLKQSQVDLDKALPLVASLLSFEREDQTVFSNAVRSELIAFIVEMLHAIAQNKTLLFVVEDLHWADPSTLEVINRLVSERTVSGMLSLFTTRPQLSLPWESRSNVTTLNLETLSRRSTHDLVSNILKDLNLTEEFVTQLVNEAGGNPLFAEELAKSTLERIQSDPNHKAKGLVLPGTLRRSLASRVDNLGKTKSLLQLCSMLGREFNWKLLNSVSETQDETTLREELDKLVAAEFLNQQVSLSESTYVFKHILMQETAYKSMLKATRKALHKRVAKVLEQQSKGKELKPEILAYHYEGCEQFDKAVANWTIAGSKSLASFALAEAEELANKGLNVINKLPESKQRHMAEIALQAIRGRALLTARGYAEPEVEKTFSRALELCKEIGDAPQLFSLQVGLWSYFQIGGPVQNALDVAKALIRLAEAEDSPAKKVQALYSLGYTNYRRGNYTAALNNLNSAQEITDKNDDDYTKYSPSGDDGRIHNLAVAAHINWQLGNVDEAVELGRNAIALAKKLENPVGEVFALFLNTWLMQLNKNYQATIEWGTKTVALATAKQLSFWITNSKFIMAWARYHDQRANNGQGPNEQIEIMIDLLGRTAQLGSLFGTVSMYLDTAEALAFNQRIDEASAFITKAKQLISETDERYIESELYRLEGLIAELADNTDQAVESYVKAQKVAESMGGFSLRLRAAEKLSQLYQDNGEPEKSIQVMKAAQQLIVADPQSDTEQSEVLTH